MVLTVPNNEKQQKSTHCRRISDNTVNFKDCHLPLTIGLATPQAWAIEWITVIGGETNSCWQILLQVQKHREGFQLCQELWNRHFLWQHFALLFLFNMNEGIVLYRTFVNVVVEHSRDEYVVLLWVLLVVAVVQFKRIQTLDCYHDMIMKSITVRKQLIWPSDIQPHQQQLWIEAHYLLTSRGSQSILCHWLAMTVQHQLV